LGSRPRLDSRLQCEKTSKLGHRMEFIDEPAAKREVARRVEQRAHAVRNARRKLYVGERSVQVGEAAPMALAFVPFDELLQRIQRRGALQPTRRSNSRRIPAKPHPSDQ